MTDVPRRSYPLVVAPPGGFEDAVRRGRRLRRRRVGGSSSLALVLVGALGYSVLGGGSGVSRIDPTNDDRKHERSAPAQIIQIAPTTSPEPSVTAGPRPGAISTQGPGSYTGVRPTAGPSTNVIAPTRRPGGNDTPGRRYASRPTITREEAVTNTDPGCLSSTTPWCGWATADDSQAATDGRYELGYTLCRTVNAGMGRLTFDWRQEIDFKTVDTAHSDTVWTYSAGVPRIREPEVLEIAPNECVTWHMTWDGLDDFGYTPPAGTYTLVARPMSREAITEAQREFTHQ